MKNTCWLFFLLVICLFPSCQWLPEVGKVSLSESSVTLKVGGSKLLVANVDPANAEYEQFSWNSSDPSIVSVSNGRIVALNVGTAQITASVAGVTSSPCQVTVSKTPVSNVSLDKSSVSILEGESLSLKVTVSPSDATNGSVTWSTGNSKVATVSSTGTITAVEEGETTITAKSADSGISATCKVVVTAEYVDFPDPNFRKYMVENFDLNWNGKISLTEAKKVKTIKVSTVDIESLDGIEYLDNLIRLEVGNNPGSWSSSRNADGSWSNYDFSNPRGKLTSLDVSNNTKLEYLDFEYNSVSNIDLSNNTALTFLRCDLNEMTSLDVTRNTALTSLYCHSNQLTSLDVTRNTALTFLYCHSNQLTSLDVSKNTALTYLSCYSNQLTSLDVSKNTALKSLSCYSNQLTTLDVSKNNSLTYFDCSPMSTLKTLYVSSGQSIDHVTTNRRTSYVPAGTSIVTK